MKPPQFDVKIVAGKKIIIWNKEEKKPKPKIDSAVLDEKANNTGKDNEPKKENNSKRKNETSSESEDSSSITEVGKKLIGKEFETKPLKKAVGRWGRAVNKLGKEIKKTKQREREELIDLETGKSSSSSDKAGTETKAPSLPTLLLPFTLHV